MVKVIRTRILILICAMSATIMACADTFSYRFNSTPLPKAIQQIMESHPNIEINFIYNELENYYTNATVSADNIYTALRQAVGQNPVSVVKANDTYYIEALQHGKYIYTGRVLGSDNEPVVAATVMLLAPKDSTVVTFGIADKEGLFRIPCDRRNVIAKLSCIGYRTTYHPCNSFDIGNIIMPTQSVNLNSITIEGADSQLYPDRSIYIPTRRQKNAAQNAIDLLRHMAIPQIRINPINDIVTDNVGASVAIYINFLQASKEELEGLRPSDVRRVEYHEFPTDPRFRRESRVINIIVHEYLYGGYTKVTANENFLVGISSRVNCFSKFSYKKMTYDLYVGANHLNNHHIGSISEGLYRLTDKNGKDYSLIRRETVNSSHYKQNQYPITLRATYNNDKIQIRHLIALTNLNIPSNEYSGKVEFLPNIENVFSFDKKNPNHSNSVAYASTYFFTFHNGFSLDFSPSFNYTHDNDYTDYSMSNLPTIYRHAKENAYNYRMNLYLRKSFGTKHSIMIGSNYGDYINQLKYTGNIGYKDKFHIPFAAAMAGYAFQNQNININLDAGMCWENSQINRQKNSDSYPFTHINVRHVHNHKSSFSAYLEYATNSPGISKKSSDILKENELMYITGNPMLENCRITTFNLSYTWTPSNAFMMSVYGHSFKMFKRQLRIYTPYDSGKALLRSYINNGDFLNEEIGLSVNWKLLNGKLQLHAKPSQSFYRSTGIFNKRCNQFRIIAQANYYLDCFYFQVYYESEETGISSGSPQINKVRNYHSANVGWTKSKWNIRITAANFFNKGWNGSTNTIFSSYYNESRTFISTFAHPRINLTATYTFGYGKKVLQGNEVSEQPGATSAILK